MDATLNESSRPTGNAGSGALLVAELEGDGKGDVVADVVGAARASDWDPLTVEDKSARPSWRVGIDE